MASKEKLSKGILEMKFMKRTALRETKLDAEETQQIDDQHWVLDLPQLAEKECNFVMDPSYASLEELPFGRMSFRGFNPEIEKIMKSNNTDIQLAAAEVRERENAVSDVEMAERYVSLSSTIAKKFTKKKKRTHMAANSDSDKESDDVRNKKDKIVEDMSEKQTKKGKHKNKTKKDAKGFMIPNDD